jgi:hypothetical protein
MQTKLLPQNIGTADRLLRFALGVVLLSLVFVGPESAWGYLGLIPLATALIGSCPFYTALGLSTRPLRPRTH